MVMATVDNKGSAKNGLVIILRWIRSNIAVVVVVVVVVVIIVHCYHHQKKIKVVCCVPPRLLCNTSADMLSSPAAE